MPSGLIALSMATRVENHTSSMRYEPRWTKRARLVQQWHRKFALFPKEIEGTKVWLEYYWQRYVSWPQPKTQEEWDHWFWRQRIMLASRFMVNLTWGHWEFSLRAPAEIGSKVVFLRAQR